MRGVREGDIISVSSLESFDRYVSSQAHQGPFLNALKHLVTTKTSEIKVLPSGLRSPGARGGWGVARGPHHDDARFAR